MIVNPSGPKCPIVGFLSLKDGIFVGVHLGRGYGYRHVDPSGYGITMEDLGWRYGLGAAYKPS